MAYQRPHDLRREQIPRKMAHTKLPPGQIGARFSAARNVGALNYAGLVPRECGAVAFNSAVPNQAAKAGRKGLTAAAKRRKALIYNFA